MYLEGRRTGAFQVFVRPVGRFIKMYLLRLGFLEGPHGLVLSMLGAVSVYLKYARLWEMSVLRQPPELPSPVESAGPLVREQIGRMMDEEMRSGPS